jgi:hypothetical protein
MRIRIISAITAALLVGCAEPKNSDLKPYYPSPYADRNWLVGTDCVWAWGTAPLNSVWSPLGHWEGTCRYYGNGNNDGSQQGYAEVHWWYLDLIPLSATPCDLRPYHGGKNPPDPAHKPFCPLPVKYKVNQAR